jgi:hypothetical protein
MATVSNVTLDIQHGGPGAPLPGGPGRTVTVTYRVCFTRCEILAGTTFAETVRLFGQDPGVEEPLSSFFQPLFRGCVAAPGRNENRTCVDREMTGQVLRSRLDEDADLMGQVSDEVFARVTLTPFAPTGSTGDSNVVSGQWGPLGGD